MKPPSIIDLPWRVGGQVGRTLYVDTGVKDPENLFGLVDDADVATHIVNMHNLWLRIMNASYVLGVRAAVHDLRVTGDGGGSDA